MTIFSDETVMRYVDGELDEETCVLIEAALATDPDLTARLEMFAQSRLVVQEAVQPLINEPVPAELRLAVENMVEQASREPTAMVLPTPANDWWRLAAAACIAGVLGGIGGYFLAPSAGGPAGVQLAGLDEKVLADALSSLPSGQERAIAGGTDRLRAIASFRDKDQSLCREFQLDVTNRSAITSVACRDAGKWVVRFAIDLPHSNGTGAYAPASASEVLDAYLSGIGAQQPLPEAAERAALESFGKARE